MSELFSKDTEKKFDLEITAVCCVYDPADELGEKMASFIAVGWDRGVHIWNDDKEEEVLTARDLPTNG